MLVAVVVVDILLVAPQPQLVDLVVVVVVVQTGMAEVEPLLVMEL
jgi:hypothetical protein